MQRRNLIVTAMILWVACTALVIAEPTVVRYGRWASGTETVDFQALVDQFNNTVGKEKNVQVKFEALAWGSYWDKLRTTIQSGDAPDVISLSNAGENAAYLTRGVFVALDKFPGAKEAIADLAGPALASLTVNGKTMGVPLGLGVRAMVYNKDLIKAAGLPEPDPVKPMTWTTFLDYARKLSVKGADGTFTQITMVASMVELADSIAYQYGSSFLDDRSKPSAVTINSVAGIKALTLVQDLFKSNVVPPDADGWNTPYGNPDNAVASGKTAFMLAGPWGMPGVRNAKVNFGTCPLPYVDGLEKNRGTRGYVNGLAIYRGSKVQPAAWEFVKWLISPDGQRYFTKTGDLPANVTALADAQAKAAELYKTNGTPEQYRAYFAELPYVISGYALPSSEWNGLYETTLGELFKFKLSPAAAAKKLETEGNALLDGIWD